MDNKLIKHHGKEINIGASKSERLKVKGEKTLAKKKIVNENECERERWKMERESSRENIILTPTQNLRSK